MSKSAVRFARTAALVAIALAALPAQAQVASGSFRSMTKTDAILGGSPSALAAITSQQGGRPLYSSYVVPAGRNANFRPAVANIVRQPVSSDRPDVFNSVALSIGRSPLDARWNEVSGAGVGGNAGAFAGSLRGQDVLAKLEAVNGYVNARVRFVDDRVQFGVADRWQVPSDTLTRGRGDCEDFALAKRAMLRAAGVPDKDLYLVVLKDLSRRADHAVLVVRAASRFLVLDNGTDRIVDSSDVADYKPMLTFAAAGRSYTHGYRRDMPPVTYAANRVTAPVVLAEARFEPSSGDGQLPDVVRETASLISTTISL
ncbi:MAG TPA: transglutaminase-like cysteine peptidase [Sphingomicrobium sp.]|jgi:predicted transglutaminase-like cysteine proteinase|nr:transglutaminase-like cysteine peptidase [Sphingomicrobium sp.]